jgi:uncharacterized protein YabN with tetrapyrrole methylase and pyrophosphatase domain
MTENTDHKTALQRAQHLQVEGAKTGFEWDNIDQIFEKLTEEIDEVKVAISNNDQINIKEELGDVLFVVTNLAKNLGFQAEDCLTYANQKLEKRYAGMFELFDKHYPNTNPQDISLEQWDKLWNIQKQREKAAN